MIQFFIYLSTTTHILFGYSNSAAGCSQLLDSDDVYGSHVQEFCRKLGPEIPSELTLMNSVFDSNRTGEEVVLWARYWVELNMYEESLQTGVVEDVPMMRK